MSKALLGATWLDRRREPSLVAGLIFIALLALASPATAKALSLNEALAAAYATNPQLAAARARSAQGRRGVPQALATGRPTAARRRRYRCHQRGGRPLWQLGQRDQYPDQNRAGRRDRRHRCRLWTGGRVDAAVAGARSRIEAEPGGAALDRAGCAASGRPPPMSTCSGAQKVIDVDHEHEHDLYVRAGLGPAALKRRASSRATDVGGRERADLAQPPLIVPRPKAISMLARAGLPRRVGAEPEAPAAGPAAAGPAGLARGVRDRSSCRHPALAAANRNVDAARSGPRQRTGADAPQPRRHRQPRGALFVGRGAAHGPLFDGGVAKSQSRGAKQELEQRRLELDGQRITARQDAVTAWDSLQTARAGIEADEAQVRLPRGARWSRARGGRKGLGHSSTSWPRSSTCSTPNLRSQAPVETSWSAPTGCLPLPDS